MMMFRLIPSLSMCRSQCQQVSVADEPARRAISRKTCCKQRWTLSVINLRPSEVDNACDGRRFRLIASYLSKLANFDLPDLHLPPSLEVIPLEFCRDLRRQKTRVPGLSCGVVYVILRLAVSVEHRLVTDRQTDRLTTTAYTTLECMALRGKYWCCYSSMMME